MTKSAEIRHLRSEETELLPDLYRAAFPDEDLVPLVRELLTLGDGVLSLGAFRGTQLLGHAVFTLCDVPPARANAALLGPLAVHPETQRQGLGRALVTSGLDHLAARAVAQVFVLGDPAYYQRLGFGQEAQVTPPMPIPKDWAPAWQSQTLSGAGALGPETLRVPAPWRVAAYWSP